VEGKRAESAARRRLADFFVDLPSRAVDGLGVEDALAEEVHLEIVNGIALGFGLLRSVSGR
jgi:hypothetical protein